MSLECTLFQPNGDPLFALVQPGHPFVIKNYLGGSLSIVAIHCPPEMTEEVEGEIHVLNKRQAEVVIERVDNDQPVADETFNGGTLFRKLSPDSTFECYMSTPSGAIGRLVTKNLGEFHPSLN